MNMHRPSLEERFAQVQNNLAGVSDAALLDYPISTWVLSTDRHLPQSFLSRPVRDLLALSYDQINKTPGVGERRIAKLLDVLERVTKNPSPRRPLEALDLPGGDETASSQITLVAPEHLTEPIWQGWCRAIHAHQLEHENLGRFADSLDELQQGLWSVPLSEYANRSLAEIRTMPVHGPARVGQILDVFSRIVQTIAACPADAPLAIRLLPPLVRDVLFWTEKVLNEQSAPSIQEIRERFLKPLFTLLEVDMGPETAAIVRRRIGLDGPVETLEQIANDVSLTRERVRQLSRKAVEITRTRWPEGRYILDNIYAHFRLLPGCGEQLELMHSVLDSCFALEFTRGGSRADVLAAWDRAGRAKRTPMTEAGVRSWTAEVFPDQPADVIRCWLEEEGLRYALAGSEAVFFSKDPLDTLLLHLHTHPEPLPVSELTDFVEGDERNIRNRLDRDPRFIEDEFKRVLPAEQCSFFRRDGRWFIRLEPLQTVDVARRADSIGVSELVHLVVGGLIQAGICDATVWGVHRFTLSLLRMVYAATLANTVTPFILASTFVRHSDGLIRHMRRRRLRWDSADGSLSVRGKRGWVDFVTTAAGVPMTFDELDAALRDRFQDYEQYVLKQLHLNEDEEGETNYGYQFVPGVSNVVPTVIVPRGWELNLATQNVSEGVRLAVAKFVSMSTRSPFPKQHLRRLPWMVRLCDHAAFGKMCWEEQAVSVEDDIPSEEPIPESVKPPPAEEVPPPKAAESTAVDDLLSRFF